MTMITNLNKLALFISCSGSPLRDAVNYLAFIYRVTFSHSARGGAPLQRREQKLPGLITTSDLGESTYLDFDTAMSNIN